jgi:hypothetical protein
VNEGTKPNTPAPCRRYPQLDAALETKDPTIVARMEKTRAGMDRLSRTGTAREKERARAALGAYGRALELYRHLIGLRDETLRTVSNMRNGAAISH